MKTKRKEAPVKTQYITGNLSCQRCATLWLTIDLNEHRKTIQCPVCAETNDIGEARKRAA